MEGRARVVIVDACRSGAPVGSVTRLDGRADALPGWLRSVSSHGIGIAEAVGLARALDMLPERVEIWAIEGRGFAPGDALSPGVARAVSEVAGAIARALARTPLRPQD
ncbi:MAG: hydrogenase maturation protease, partial [Alphaproteobacteria bacterium]